MIRLLSTLSLAASVSATEILVPVTINPGNSSLRLELCVQSPFGTDCDDDTRAISGTLLLAVECTPALGRVALRDFTIRAVSNHQFSLFSGLLTAGVTNLEIYHAAPGTPPAFVPWTNGQAVFLNVPNLLRGTARYQASPAVCPFLAPRPCADTIDLSRQPTNTLDDLPVPQLTIVSNRLQFRGTFDFNVPINADDPGAGTLAGVALLAGTGPLAPCIAIEFGAFNHVVRWAREFTGFRLFRTTALSPSTAWMPAGIEPVDEGTTWAVTLPNESGNVFYRLSTE